MEGPVLYGSLVLFAFSSYWAFMVPRGGSYLILVMAWEQIL